MEDSRGGDSSPSLHFVLFPLMVQGHMIPVVDMARLFAARGVLATVITTPANASRFRPAVDRASASGLPVQLVEIPFPWREAGLPEGCENLDALPAKELVANFFTATGLLRGPVERYLSESQPPASCIISDMGLPWTGETARVLGIPRLVFHGTCCFSLLCSQSVRQSRAHEAAASDHERFVVPGLPHRVEITRAQLPENFAGAAKSSSSSSSFSMQGLRDQIRGAESAAHGVVVNSFLDLEPAYVESYQKATGKKAWTIGPVSICNRAASERANRGNKASIDEGECLSWLDKMNPKSVIYVSFGSIARFAPLQLIEIGLGLEASNSPFIWVIKAGESSLPEVEGWLSEGFEERTRGRGLLIRGWAPQVLILSHPAVGGFLTHCGWNSTLEGVSAGVPMITWPLFAEQFFNEKLVVEVLRIGVSLGVTVPTRWGDEDKAGVVVGREAVRMAVERLMGGGGEESDEDGRRRRAGGLGEMAVRAMEEGGSSYVNVTLLIQDIIKYHSDTNKK